MSADCDSIFKAALYSSTELLKLLRQKCDPNIESLADGFTPLFWAAFARKPDSAILLISYGADVNKTAKPKIEELPVSITPLHAAAYSGSLAVAKILKENGADLNSKDEVGQTPLHYCACDNVLVVSALLNGGADPLTKDINGFTPLFHCLSSYTDYYNGRDFKIEALENSESEYEEFLNFDNDDLNLDKICCAMLDKLKHVGDIKFSGNRSVLHLSIEFRHRFVNEYILNNFNVDLNARDSQGLTPLHYAAYSYKKEVWPSQILIDKGANPFVSSNDGLFPLDIAINYGNEAVIEILKQLGAPENQKTREALNNKLEVNKKDDPSLDQKSDNLNSKVFVSYNFPFIRNWPDKLFDLSSYLISQGANVNTQDSMGHTPLHRAVLPNYEGNQQIINLELYLGELILWPGLNEWDE